MNLEKAAVGYLEHLFASSNQVEPYLSDNDREPSFDGFLKVFKKNNDQNSKKHYLGDVYVQVKGVAVSSFSDNTRTYPIGIIDLKNFRTKGGVIFFVVEINKDSDQIDNTRKAFYRCLLPYDIDEILEGIKEGQKQKSVSLTVMPKRISKVTKTIIKCLENINAQKSIANISSKKMIANLLQSQKTLPPITFGQNEVLNEDSLEDLVEYDTYIYLNFFPGLTVPIGKLEPEFVRLEKTYKAKVLIGNQEFYSSFKKVRSSNETIIKFGESLEANLVAKKMKFQLQGGLVQRINDLVFLKALIGADELIVCEPSSDEELFSFHGNEFKNNSQKFIEVQTRVDNLLDHYLNLKNILKNLGVSQIDWINLDLWKSDDLTLLEDLSLGRVPHNEEFFIPDSNLILHRFRFEDLSLLFWVTQDCDELKPFISQEISCFYQIDSKCFPFSRYVCLREEDFLAVSNFDWTLVYCDLIKFEPTDLYRNFVNVLLLNIISAIDKLTVEMPCGELRRNQMIDLGIQISGWLLEISPKSEIDFHQLNYLQLVARKRSLLTDEIDSLVCMVESDNYDEIYAGAYILMNDYEKLERRLRKMSAEQCQNFLQHPIAHLIPERVLNKFKSIISNK